MPTREHICAESLDTEDVLADLALFLTGSKDIDGITIEDAEVDPFGLVVTFTDPAGHQQTATLQVTGIG